MTNKHSSFTGSIPEVYDTCLGPYLFEFSARDLADRVKDKIPVDGKIIEVACGTGISTHYLRKALPESVHILATDLNPAMLDFAISKHANLPGVTFEVANAQAIMQRFCGLNEAKSPRERTSSATSPNNGTCDTLAVPNANTILARL